MYKFYLSSSLQDRGLNLGDMQRVQEVIKDKVAGAADTECTGRVAVEDVGNLFYKAASYDSTGLFSMPFRTGTHIKVIVWDELENPNSFDRPFVVGLV